MAKTPTPQSFEQILGQMLSTYMSKIGVNDLNTGSVTTSFFESVAQSIYRGTSDVFTILRDASVDRAEGEALKRIAKEENIQILPARVATGEVTITDTSFQKISTKIYAGSPPPNIGTTTLLVSDASQFPATGQIYIGRGTPNIEGPISYTSIASSGSFYTITLATPITKYHNINESVIYAQGGVRTIPAGTAMTTDPSGAGGGVSFSTTKSATILDGEVEITNVPIVAEEPGADANVSRNSIKNFVTPPFSGASVTNPNPLTTGRNEETDEELRNKIKKARISKGLGTELAIESATSGVQAPDENAIVTSNNIFFDGDKTTLFIDNGDGYEEKTEGVGFESIVDSALGGEQFFQLSTGGTQTSIAKAFLETNFSAPYAINGGDKLTLLVGGILSEHTFNASDFKTEGSVSSFEIVSSINANADLLFTARTIENGTKLRFSAKSETDEYIQKITPQSGVDAGINLGLATTEVDTLRLYKNNKALNKNGRAPIIESDNQSAWASNILTGETLIISVDGTAPITYTFTDADFALEGTHTTVSAFNTLQSWANVINAKIVGVTAKVSGTKLTLTSNLGANSRASLTIDPASTLVTKGMFSTSLGLSDSGVESDYVLSRNTGQLKLTTALSAGDSLTAGSELTKAAIRTDKIISGQVSVPSDALLWTIVDNPNAKIIPHGVVTDSVFDFNKKPANAVRFKSSITNAFANVQVGDYVIMWSEELDINNRIEGRVSAVGQQVNPFDYFEVTLTSAEYALAVNQSSVVFQEGIAFVRSDNPPQKLRLAGGPSTSYNIHTLSTTFSNDLIGASARVENDEILVFETNNQSENGSILLVTLNKGAKNLKFTAGDSAKSTFSHFGFTLSADSSERFPTFVHGTMAQERSADTPVNFIPDFATAVDLSTLGIDPNAIMCLQDAYLTNGVFVRNGQATDECVQIKNISGTTVSINPSKTIRRIKNNERFYVVNPLDFAANDTLTTVIDNDTSQKTFPINVFRNGSTNTTMPVNNLQFRAFDDDGGSVEFSQFFGSTFNFANYKVFMKAKNVIDPSSLTTEDAILFRATEWGAAGERIHISYEYPSSANQSVTHTIEVTDKVIIKLFFKSGASVTNTIDSTTEWNVTITPNTPVIGVDEVTYTYSGTGTSPGLGTLAAGNYVKINPNSGFSAGNQGVFKIISSTANSFTVRRPSGVAVAESNVVTGAIDAIDLYKNLDTTAKEIVTYVTDNLSEWIVATLLDDTGLTGAGIINNSTYEDTNFTLPDVSLVDGINWIESSDLSAVAPDPQFTFKKALLLPSRNTTTVDAYAFNKSEPIRLVPTTLEQLKDYLSVLAVTGITTVSEIIDVNRGLNLQLATNTLGNSGSVLVTGGSANKSTALIINNASKIPNTQFIKANIDRASSGGISAGSWLKLQAANLQKKNIGISFTTQVTITPNSPTPNESTITLSNREFQDRYFGLPTKYFRDNGRAFHVEKHGALVNISWDKATGSNPFFSKTINLNDAGSATVAVSFDSTNLVTNYTVSSGAWSFNELNIGDLLTVTNLTDAANNGTFRILGISPDAKTVSLNNDKGVTAAGISLPSGSFSSTSSIKEGDIVEIGSPFSSLNQGKFRVIRVGDQSIYIDNPQAVEERVVVSSNLRNLGFDNSTQFTVSVPGNMRIDWNSLGTPPTLANAKVGDILTVGTAFALQNQGDFMVVDSGDSYIELANANAAPQGAVTVTGVGGDILEAHAPALVFSDYNTVRKGDKIVLTGDVLGTANIGSYVISDILSQDRAVVSAIMAATTSTQLNNKAIQMYIEEEKPYVGYKRVFNHLVDPTDTEKTILIFDTDNNFDKINQAASITTAVQSKLGFIEETVKGFDAYKYHTGLLRQINKTVYGDPRDSTTFPGVAAAGAEIFIEPPLVRRIQISINVRVNTGVPFARITDQVRSNVASLINSSPIGESIAISDIISSVNSIPGTRAISITFPDFTPQNDLIKINPSEKPFVLDVINDIIVTKVG